jgi:hypothetical protein
VSWNCVFETQTPGEESTKCLHLHCDVSFSNMEKTGGKSRDRQDPKKHHGQSAKIAAVKKGDPCVARRRV